MSVRTISTKLAIDGEAQYKKAISECNSALSSLKSSLSLVESEFRNNANSMEALTAKSSALDSVYAKQKEKVSELERALANAQEHQAAYAELAADASKKVAEYSAELDKLKESVGDTQQQQAELTAEIEKWGTVQSEAETASRAAEKSVQAWQKQLNNAKIAANQLDDEIAKNNQYLDEARSSADGCATSIDRYGKEVREAGDKSKEAGEKGKEAIEQLAGILAAAGIAKGVHEIAAALMECSDAAGAFETSINKISTIADTSVVSMDAIKNWIVTLSGETGKSSASIAEAVYNAISSGVETSKAVESVEKAARLAAGGFTSVETSVDVLTTALNAYKLKASETEKVSDILITTQKKGKTSVDELAQSVGKVIPLAAAYNVQMDNLGTAYAVLTANGIATAEAGTYLKSMINELGDSSSKVAGLLREKTGQSFADLTKAGRSMGDVLAMLGDSVGGSATAFNELWSSTEAGIGALSIFNSGADQFNDVLEEMQNSAGATEAAYQKMASGNEFASQRMANAAENLKIAIGDQLNPALAQLYNSGADAFNWAADFVEENPEVVGAVVAVTTGVGALTVGLTLAANASQLAAMKQAALNAVMNANPVGLLVTGLTALAAAITAYSLTMERADAEAQSFVKSLKESRDAYQELTESMAAEKTSVTDTIRALQNLLDAEDKSATRKDQILRLVEELNEKVPGLALAYDETADAVNMTSDALERVAESAREQEEQEARVARLNELFTQREAVTRELTESQNRLDEAMANARWDSFGGTMNDAAVDVEQLRGGVETLTAALAETEAEITELEAAATAYNEQQAESAVQTDEFTARMESLRAELETLEAAYNESYSAAMESINGQMGLFQEMDGSAKTSIDNLIATLEGQVDYMAAYNENIRKAMEMGVDQGLVKKLSDGSEQSAQILAAIVQGGTEDIQALNEQLAKVEEGKESFSNSIAEMETGFKEKMDAVGRDLRGMIDEVNLKEEAYKVGWNNVQGLINGTADQKRALIAKYAEMGKAAVAAYKKAVGQHSPSREFQKAGSYDIRGLISGAESEKGHLKEAYIDLAETASLGVAEGLASGGGKAVQAADKLAGEVYSRNKTWIDRQAKYQSLTLREQLELWEAVQGQFIRDSKQYAQAEEQIYELKAKMQDEYLKKVEEVNKKVSSLEKAYQDEVSKRTKEIFNSYKLFDKASDREEVSGDELIGNLQSQVERMKDFYAGLRELSERGVGDALVEEIRAMGPGAMDELDALLSLGDLKLLEYADLYREKQRMASQQALEELRPLRAETDRQIQESLGELTDAYREAAPAAGTAFSEGVAAGMLDGAGTVAAAAEAVAREAAAAAEQAMRTRSYGGVGYDPQVDYSALMAAAKDREEFDRLAAQREAKIAGEQINLAQRQYEDNAALLARWQASMAQAEEKARETSAAISEQLAGGVNELNGGASDMGKDFVNGIIAGIKDRAQALNQTVSRMTEDLKVCLEADLRPIREQIGASVAVLAAETASAVRDDRSGSAQDLATAVREALSGMSVNMNARKVGEMITGWQKNNDRGRGV